MYMLHLKLVHAGYMTSEIWHVCAYWGQEIPGCNILMNGRTAIWFCREPVYLCFRIWSQSKTFIISFWYAFICSKSLCYSAFCDIQVYSAIFFSYACSWIFKASVKSFKFNDKQTSTVLTFTIS